MTTTDSTPPPGSVVLTMTATADAEVIKAADIPTTKE
jgi:hypothetical protein